MSEVKKISPVGNIYGWEESQFGEFVLSQDYDDLADEAKALREEVAALRMARDDFKLERDLARQNFCDEQAANYQLQAHLKSCLGELAELRARVVVVPERITPFPENIDKLDPVRCGWNACLDELARLNGLTVSEGLLRRVCAEQPATCCMDDEMSWRRDRDSALIELRALLNEDKENGNG
ncbi:TPA: hypothetical protein ACM2X8_001068 [Pseudomonas aeruginosa]|uniref:hypothetical protein n=1 Tax=Pseudomonas aeruginosa TaxID=287 RepID=UPI000D370B35|nr:hypothetical protein [Pseudomonas aeruginosa]MBH4486801.1 hypothetical protein [Pseudomonas aeruginosa]MBH4526988.1 hypothetical protein [Pseudomonas aeruginosa]HDP3382743.1 hypothetical protein [Pseudomonas aeruginosa]